MDNHQALKKCVGRFSEEISKAVRVQRVTLYKWMEPHADPEDSGSYSPIDRLEAIIEKALDLGQDRDDALTPLYHLNKRFGLNTSAIETCEDEADLSLELAATLREVGHLTTVASEALSSGEISRVAADRIEEEGNHLIRRVTAFCKKTRELTHKRLSIRLFTRKKAVNQ